MSDQSMTPELKRSRIADIQDKIKKSYAELAQYTKDTAGVEDIAKRIREQK